MNFCVDKTRGHYRVKKKEVRESNVERISQVSRNCLKYITDNPKVFIVASDGFNLYLEIAKRNGLKIIEECKRPVLNRTSRDKNADYESIFVFVKGETRKCYISFL